MQPTYQTGTVCGLFLFYLFDVLECAVSALNAASSLVETALFHGRGWWVLVRSTRKVVVLWVKRGANASAVICLCLLMTTLGFYGMWESRGGWNDALVDTVIVEGCWIR